MTPAGQIVELARYRIPAGERALQAGASTAVVGWPGALQPPAPSDPGVTVSRHRALLTSSVRSALSRPLENGPRSAG